METSPASPVGQSSPTPGTASVPPTPTGWIGWALIAGAVVAVPIGWLLAYLAALPFMLGIFFFLVLGLITGATMFRFGSKAALPATWVLWFIGSTVAIILSLTSLWAEYQALPGGVKNVVRKTYYASFTQQDLADLQAQVRSHVDSYLADQYPPGGLVGYVKWAARNGTMTVPRFQKPGDVQYRLLHKQGKWLFRVVLCALLVEWTIMSQMLALRNRKDQAQGYTMDRLVTLE
jgi:hypothetical protein